MEKTRINKDHMQISRRTALYPSLEPYASGMLDLGGGHQMYWETSGNPDGQPVIFVHGGPGAGSHSHHRRYFSPKHYRIIVFDQRGAGRSTPLGGLIDNTTGHLVADMEALRDHLGVERWVLFGGSWGSTLALAYGEAHPKHCLGFILRGIFLCRKSEIDWFLYGMGGIFPEAWRRFSEFLPVEERGDLLAAYHRRLVDPDASVHMPAARSWSAYEGACSSLRHTPPSEAAPDEKPKSEPKAETGIKSGGDVMAFGISRIEAHYFVNDMFTPENALLENIGQLAGIPAVIIQGRYDMGCPIHTADELVRAWTAEASAISPTCVPEYHIIPDAGHAASEPGTRAALMAATEQFKALQG